MKKILVIILALAMIFAMGTVVLAEEGVGNQGDMTNNSGQTKVTVEVNATNLSVTVPIDMTIVAPALGGDCTVPNNYAIVNKCALPIKVTKIAVTDADGGLIFSDDAPEATVADKDKISIALTPTGGTLLQLNKTTAIESGLGGFDIAAASDVSVGVSKAIAITAKSGMLSSADEQADAFTITFTVAAGTTVVPES